MAGKKRKMTKRTKKKILKAIFGKALPTVLLIVALFTLAFHCLYNYNDSFHAFVDESILHKTTVAPRPYIDPNGTEMAVHFIDVGQGDSTLFHTSAGSVLVDCGEPEYGETVVEYLQSQGIDELEYFIITHPDSDHMGSAAYVLKNVEVKTLVINGQEKAIMEPVLDAALEKQVDTWVVEPGDVIEVGALRMAVCGPYRLDYSSSEWNNASIVLHATFGHRSFLLTGDAEKPAEKDIVENNMGGLKCDVFSAGHHGSKTSNTQDLLDEADPQYVVISCGFENKHKHPSEEVVERFEAMGIEILRTDMLGSIVFITDGESLELKTEKPITE